MSEPEPANSETRWDKHSSPRFRVSFFRVPLVCEAAPTVGCGTIARPVLAGLERQASVREAWLKRDGTVLRIVWGDGARDPRAVLSALHRRGIEVTAVKGSEYWRNHESFAAGAWCRWTQMQDLSAEEGRVIAARLAHRLERNVSVSPETRERLMKALEQACGVALAAASATSDSARREQIAAALRDVARDILDPPAFAAFTTVVSLGHRPLPGEP